MSNTYTLLNCESDILVIKFDKNKITAQALLDDGSGKISFEIQKFEIIKYLHSDLTLNQLLQRSSITNVELYDYKTKSKSKISKQLIGTLTCGNSLFNNLPLGMKMPFAERIELAVRANYLALNFNKIMEMVKYYYYLNEKLLFLRYTFGEKNIFKLRCEKQLEDIRQNLIELEIPFEFGDYDEIQKLGIKEICLKNELGLDHVEIIQKDLKSITDIEMNYLVYKISDVIVDINEKPKFWIKKQKKKYLKEFKNDYYPFKRNILIDDILK